MDEIYGTGRIASPFHSPDGKAFALYHDGVTTLWYYAGTNQVVIQTTAPDEQRQEIKQRIMHKLRSAESTSRDVIARAKQAIELANQSIARATEAITRNKNDIVSFNSAMMEIDRQWPDQGGFDD